MKMRHLYFFAVILLIFSCNGSVISTVPNPGSNEDAICDCIASTSTSVNPNLEFNALMDCVSSKTRNKKDSMLLLLASTYYNCEGFSQRLSKLSLSKAGCDTIQFSTPTFFECQNSRVGKWKDVLSDQTHYSMLYNNRIEHFVADTLVGIWKIVDKGNCQVTYLVMEQKEASPLPPNVGDTVIATTLGINGEFVKNLVQINGIEIYTIGVKLEE